MDPAVITDEIDNDLDHALAVMAEYGVSGAELRTVGDKNISEVSAGEVEEIRRTLDRHGAHAVCIASPFFKTDLPDTGDGPTGALHGASTVGFEDQMALLERCIGTAKGLGAKLVRTFTFWKHGILTPEIEDRIVDAYAVPARMAEDAGVVLVVENEHACYTGTGAETARVVSRIDSPAVKIVWDPGNAVFAGEKAMPVGYEAVRGLTAHVHVKDARAVGTAGEVEWVVLGEGIVDWPAQIAALRSDGYSGYLSLETHYRGPGTKEQSTRQCLEAMKRLLNPT